MKKYRFFLLCLFAACVMLYFSACSSAAAEDSSAGAVPDATRPAHHTELHTFD